MINDVEQYFDAVAAAGTATDEAERTLAAARQAQHTVRADAWAVLANSSDRLVAYIVNNAPDNYREQAETVLRHLPGNASAEDVRRIARENGFSGYPLDQFLSEAEAAGVFTGATDHAPVADAVPASSAAARRELENWARGIAPGYVTDTHIGALMRHVDAVVAAERNTESVTA